MYTHVTYNDIIRIEELRNECGTSVGRYAYKK